MQLKLNNSYVWHHINIILIIIIHILLDILIFAGEHASVLFSMRLNEYYL